MITLHQLHGKEKVLVFIYLPVCFLSDLGCFFSHKKAILNHFCSFYLLILDLFYILRLTRVAFFPPSTRLCLRGRLIRLVYRSLTILPQENLKKWTQEGDGDIM